MKLDGITNICLTGKVRTVYKKNLGLFDIDEAKREYQQHLLTTLSNNYTKSIDYHFHTFNPATERICQIELVVERLQTGEVIPKHTVKTVIFSSNRFPPSVLLFILLLLLLYE